MERETAIVYRQCSAGLFRYVSLLAPDAAAAQDAVQETFLRYFTARTEGVTIENPKGWLFRVARNYLLDSARAAGVRAEVGLASLAQARDETHNPESAYGAGEFQRQAFAALAPREMECVRLRAEGLDYSEIAGALAIRPGTVSALLARAHKKIRALRAPNTPSESLRFIPKETPYAS